MRIAAEPNNMFTRRPCVLCGIWERAGDVIGVVYLDDGTKTAVCDACARGSQDEIRGRIQAHAARLRIVANELDTIAAGPIELPDPAAFTAIQDQIDAKYEEDSGPARENTGIDHTPPPF